MNFEQKEYLAQLTIDNFLAPDAAVYIEVPKLIPNQDTMLTHPTHNRLTSARNHQILRVINVPGVLDLTISYITVLQLIMHLHVDTLVLILNLTITVHSPIILINLSAIEFTTSML